MKMEQDSKKVKNANDVITLFSISFFNAVVMIIVSDLYLFNYIIAAIVVAVMAIMIMRRSISGMTNCSISIITLSLNFYVLLVCYKVITL
jgi:hypothetical protein